MKMIICGLGLQVRLTKVMIFSLLILSDAGPVSEGRHLQQLLLVTNPKPRSVTEPNIGN
jgi:hypothetical protein